MVFHVLTSGRCKKNVGKARGFEHLPRELEGCKQNADIMCCTCLKHGLDSSVDCGVNCKNSGGQTEK